MIIIIISQINPIAMPVILNRRIVTSTSAIEPKSATSPDNWDICSGIQN